MAGYIHTPDSGKPIQDDNPLPIKLTGSFVVVNEFITSDTVVTAGGTLTYPLTGSYTPKGKELRVAVALSASIKHKVDYVRRTATYPTSWGIGNTVPIFDNSTTAVTGGSGKVDIQSSRYQVRVTNSDTVDMTIKAATLMEVV